MSQFHTKQEATGTSSHFKSLKRIFYKRMINLRGWEGGLTLINQLTANSLFFYDYVVVFGLIAGSTSQK